MRYDMLIDFFSESGKLNTWGSTDDLGPSYVTSGKHEVNLCHFFMPLVLVDISLSILLIHACWTLLTFYEQENPEPFPLQTDAAIVQAAAGWAHCVSVTGTF